MLVLILQTPPELRLRDREERTETGRAEVGQYSWAKYLREPTYSSSRKAGVSMSMA